MPISYSQSSSSEACFDSGCWIEDGNFGVPQYYFCEKFLILEVSSTMEIEEENTTNAQ